MLLRLSTHVLVPLGAVAALAGCGVGDDRDQARGVVERFYEAVQRGDGQGACSELSAATAAQLESQSGQRCREVVTRLDLDGRTVQHTEVFVTNAKVDLDEDESAFLSREPTGWKLTALGCKAADGKPEHRPFECEVEA